MWFRKSNDKKVPPHPGETHAVEGRDALRHVASLACDAVAVNDNPNAALALAAGQASTGLRTTAVTTSLVGGVERMHALTGRRLPVVVQLSSRAVERQTTALHGGHDDYYAVADTGAFQMFAADAQEVADLALVAHRVAETALTPGVCAQDLYGTTHSVQSVMLPQADLIERYLGHAGDDIETPSPAQSVLYGATRRRVPRLIDRDNPAGVGGTQDQDSHMNALLGQDAFGVNLCGVLDGAFRELDALTGREYERIEAYRAGDADIVFVAMGAIVCELRAAVDHLRAKHGVKAGLVNVRVYRPFPSGVLAEALQGKKAVVVLERTAASAADDPPLLRDLRGAFDRALEHGTWKSGDRPALHSGLYGVGSDVPVSRDLVAVGGRAASGDCPRRFYVGIHIDTPTRHFPHLQTLDQRLERDFPGWRGLVLPPDEVEPLERGDERSMSLLSLWAQGGVFAGNMFVEALAEATGRAVRTFPSGGMAQTLQPAKFTVAMGSSGVHHEPSSVDTLLVSVDSLLARAAAGTVLSNGAVIVVASNRTGEELWRDIPTAVVDWMAEANARLRLIDAQQLAADTASKPSFVDQLSLWALLGAYLAELGLDETVTAAIAEGLRGRLAEALGESHPLVDDVLGTLTRGAGAAVDFDWPNTDVECAPAVEPEAPWTVAQDADSDGSVFDLTRFWHSVGYFYDTGRVDRTLVDPYLASGVIPAGSSAYRDMTPYRLSVPRWLPENCTACGECWTQCPDSALPPTARSIVAIASAAVAQAESSDGAMLQMPRMVDNLGKLAYKIIDKDELGQYRDAGVLLREAFSRLVEKAGLEGDKLDSLRSEFERTVVFVDGYPVARTEPLFVEPHGRDKGTGALLSIAVNPNSCKGCGLCAAVCPEGAFEMVAQTEEIVTEHRRHWEFQMKLPADDGAWRAYVRDGDDASQAYRLLDSSAYHSLVGGDSSAPGNGARTAVHLVTAAVESVVGLRFRRHAEQLGELIGKLEDRIQGRVTGTVEINDFDAFTRKLDRVNKKDITVDTLAGMATDSAERVVDGERLARLSGLRSRLVAQRAAYVDGDGRSRLLVALDGDDGSFWNGTYPDNPHRHPWMCQLPGDSVLLAQGMLDGVIAQLTGEFADCRRARLEIDEAYDAARHEPELTSLGWADFDDDERALVPPAVVFAGGDSLGDDAHARALAGDRPLLVTVIDSSGATGTGAGSALTAGAASALDGTRAFVLQSTIAAAGHLIGGVAEAVEAGAPAMVRVYAPDPQTAGVAPEDVSRLAQTAVRGRVYPLFKRLAGADVVIAANPDVDADWCGGETVSRDASGVESTFTAPVTAADWAVMQARFAAHFRAAPKGGLGDQMKLVTDYIALEPGDREGLEPYIDVVDNTGRRFIAVVSRDIVRLCEQSAEQWRGLRSREGARGTQDAQAPVEAAPPPPQPPPSAAEVDAQLHSRLTERLLWLSGYTRDPEFFKQSLRGFVTERTHDDDPSQPSGEDGR